MHKIGVLGDRESVSGFACIGLEVFAADDAKLAHKYLRTMAEQNYAVIFITEKLACALESEIEKYSQFVSPAIIPIPGVSGNTGDGLKNVSKFVEKAVGSDILS